MHWSMDMQPTWPTSAQAWQSGLKKKKKKKKIVMGIDVQLHRGSTELRLELGILELWED